MKRRVVVEDPAKADLAEAVRWYKQFQSTLAADFRQRVRRALAHAAEYPESHPVIDRGLRRALIDRFPFAIFYLPEADSIRVFAVLHTSRDPRIWEILH